MSAELNRRLENLIRFGLIAEVDYATARARVKCGQILTDFIPFATLRTGTTQTWSPPSVGEQVIVLAMSGELTTACILSGLYTQNAPSTSAVEHVFNFPDGARITYNHSTGALNVTGIQTGTIHAKTQLDVICPTVNIRGNVNITGNVMIAGTLGTMPGANGGGGAILRSRATLKPRVKLTRMVIFAQAIFLCKTTFTKNKGTAILPVRRNHEPKHGRNFNG